MRARTRIVAIAALALSASVADSAPPPMERPPEFVAKVNAAIDRGVAFLRSSARRDGDFGTFPDYVYGLNALAYHTIRACGVPRDNDLAKATWGRLVDEFAQNRKQKLRTYSASLFLLALYDHGEPQPAAPGQVTAGPPRVKLSARDRAIAEELAEWLHGTRLPGGGWGYYPGMSCLDPRVRDVSRTPICDNSNTQFGLLGMRAASLCGIEVSDFDWLKDLEHFLADQEKPAKIEKDRKPAKSRSEAEPRGWSYVIAPWKPYGSMTAAGVSSIVICREQLEGSKRMTPELSLRCDDAVRDGLEWLGKQFDARTHPGVTHLRAKPKKEDLDLYWLYSLERAAILAGVDFLGAHDWYREGADFLCEEQQPDGAWRSPWFTAGDPGNGPHFQKRDVTRSQTDVVQTCLALLFLKRATIPAKPVVTAGGDALDFGAAAKLEGRPLADFLDLVIAGWRKSATAGARTSLEESATPLGPRIVEPLIERLDARDADVRSAASAILRRATGLDMGYSPDASDAARADAVIRWQAWWMKAGARLRFDPAKRKLVEAD